MRLQLISVSLTDLERHPVKKALETPKAAFETVQQPSHVALVAGHLQTLVPTAHRHNATSTVAAAARVLAGAAATSAKSATNCATFVRRPWSASTRSGRISLTCGVG